MTGSAWRNLESEAKALIKVWDEEDLRQEKLANIACREGLYSSFWNENPIEPSLLLSTENSWLPGSEIEGVRKNRDSRVLPVSFHLHRGDGKSQKDIFLFQIVQILALKILKKSNSPPAKPFFLIIPSESKTNKNRSPGTSFHFIETGSRGRAQVKIAFPKQENSNPYFPTLERFREAALVVKRISQRPRKDPQKPEELGILQGSFSSPFIKALSSYSSGNLFIIRQWKGGKDSPGLSRQVETELSIQASLAPEEERETLEKELENLVRGTSGKTEILEYIPGNSYCSKRLSLYSALGTQAKGKGEIRIVPFALQEDQKGLPAYTLLMGSRIIYKLLKEIGS